MKKRILSLFLCLTLLVAVTIESSAHSGGTDSRGGHRDHSTGDYHYHHGNPAHDHYDIDGDGIIDCPYNSSYWKAGEAPVWAYWVIGILLITVFILFGVIHNKNQQIELQKNSFGSTLNANEANFREGITDLHNALVQKFGSRYLYDISGAPDGDFVDDDFFPHSSDSNIDELYDNYLFYLGGSPYNSNTKYHHRSCRYARYDSAINAHWLKRNRRYSPCMLCSSRLPDTEWVNRYQKHYLFIKKHFRDNSQSTSTGRKTSVFTPTASRVLLRNLKGIQEQGNKTVSDNPKMTRGNDEILNSIYSSK